MKCYYCNKPHGFEPGQEELRPYGPSGAWVCFDCAMSTTERRQEAERQFDAALAGATIHTGVAQLTPKGPVPHIGGHHASRDDKTH